MSERRPSIFLPRLKLLTLGSLWLGVTAFTGTYVYAAQEDTNTATWVLKVQDPALPLSDRQAAAEALAQPVVISGSETSAAEKRMLAVQQILTNFSDSGAQAVMAKALYKMGTTDPRLIVPLNALLGKDQTLTEASALALSNYKSDQTVIRLLTEFVSRPVPDTSKPDATVQVRPDTSRLAVIRVLPNLPDKSTAVCLYQLLSDATEVPQVRNAAADALAELTGRYDLQRDFSNWAEWWAAQGEKSDDEWLIEFLQIRSSRLDRALRLQSDTFAAFSQVIAAQHRLADESQRVSLISGLIASPSTQPRLVALEILYADAAEGRAPVANLRPSLRALLADPSADVRREAARLLGIINDATALDQLLLALEKETDPGAKVAIARALAPIQDLRAVPPMLRQLSDRSYRASTAAAQTLADLGPLLRDSSDAQAEAAIMLLATLDRTTGLSEAAELRAACLEALAPLRQANASVVFQRFLADAEPPAVRSAALRALAELALPETAGSIIACLNSAANLPGVRLQAVTALGKIPTFDHAEALYQLLNPDNEPDLAVRTRAWEALTTLMPYASRSVLTDWAQRFSADNERLWVVLRAWEVLAVKELQAPLADETRTQLLSELTSKRVQLAQLLLSLNRPTEAEETLTLAWEKNQAGGQDKNSLLRQLVVLRASALLKARNFPRLISFSSQADKVVADTQSLLISAVKDEVAQLAGRDDAAALQMVLAFLSPESPLNTRNREELTRLEREIRGRLSATSPAAVQSALPAATPASAPAPSVQKP